MVAYQIIDETNNEVWYAKDAKELDSTLSVLKIKGSDYTTRSLRNLEEVLDSMNSWQAHQI